MGRQHRKTKEDIVAEKIVDFLSDIRLDLDLIGLYLGRYIRTTIWMRLEHIYETAKHHREKEHDIEEHYEYIRNINQ
jgi:hypothetical protein